LALTAAVCAAPKSSAHRLVSVKEEGEASPRSAVAAQRADARFGKVAPVETANAAGEKAAAQAMMTVTEKPVNPFTSALLI